MHLSVSSDQDHVPESDHLLEKYEDEAEDIVEATPPPAETTRTKLRLPSWSTCSRTCKDLGFFLLPSPIQNRIRPDLAKVTKLYQTSYLDGLRGLAAFLVFIFHFSYGSHDTHSAFGRGGKNHEFLKLPFIRFIYNGTAMVSIFFVVSGFALSYKPLKQMRGKKWDELLHTLSSAVFRRAIRLYLPCVVWTFVIIVTVYLGVYEPTRAVAYDGHFLPYHREEHMRPKATLFKQLYDWARKMYIMINPWSFNNWSSQIDIDGHLWTISVEFRASLILYLTQLGVSRMRPLVRILFLVALIIWCTRKDRWEMILFYGGFILAELDLRRSLAPALPSSSSLAASRRDRLWWLYIVVFLVGVYLCGQPGNQGGPAIGWDTLHAWIPSNWQEKHRFWTGWGAILLVWATSNSPLLQKLFTNSVSQYMGKISFALYIVHAHIIHTIGLKSLEILWNAIGRDTAWRKETAFGISAIITITFVVWMADIVTRAVDTPSVHFARWVEDKCIVPKEEDN